MKSYSKVLNITRTAVLIALLVALQAITRPLGQYVTGSAVNFILAVSVMLGGLRSGMAVALLSPLFAFLVQIGPALLPLLPFIMLGNATFVAVLYLIAAKGTAPKRLVQESIAVLAAAVAKFVVLYLGIVKLAVSVLLKLPEKQAAILSVSFSYPQFITAAVGGALALAVLPLLHRGMEKQPGSAAK